MWIITNLKIKISLTEIPYQGYNLYTDTPLHGQPPGYCQWVVQGHIFSRDKSMVCIKEENPEQLLERLYARYGDDFIHYIKGNFIILQLSDDGFRVYSDHFAIKKFFVYTSGRDFIITDNPEMITMNRGVTPSQESMAIYGLTYHFTGGKTLFNEVVHNQPAQVVTFNQNELKSRHYWDPESLLQQPKEDIHIANISQALSEAVSLGLSYADKKNISLSLTGGADTRNLLALFLSKGLKPHLYTYGNPKSGDCQKAMAISEGLDLNHHIHDITMDAGTFERYARKMVRASGGLASIHRVHRLMAVEQERQFADWMFLGTLGGEYVKGVSEDDYIVPSVVFENWGTMEYTNDLIKQFAERKHIILNDALLHNTKQFISEEPYMKGDVIVRKHNALSYITAHLHDAQDVNLYNTVMNDVFTPFLDIDYLRLLFSSGYSFDNKEVIKNSIQKKIQNPVYASLFLKHTFKPLLYYRYTGEHKPSEVLFNRYYAAVLKLIRKKTAPAYPANFPLGAWMKNFVTANLPPCKDYDAIAKTFDIDGLMGDLKRDHHDAREAYWLKYTNPIMMRFILEEFNI